MNNTQSDCHLHRGERWIPWLSMQNTSVTSSSGPGCHQALQDLALMGQDAQKMQGSNNLWMILCRRLLKILFPELPGGRRERRKEYETSFLAVFSVEDKTLQGQRLQCSGTWQTGHWIPSALFSSLLWTSENQKEKLIASLFRFRNQVVVEILV